MKRFTLLAVAVACISVVCWGQYRSGDSPATVIQLPEARPTGPFSFEQILAMRRSVRQFTNQQLSFTQMGQLAWAGQGITEKQRGFRTAPSAGALYPIRLYFATPKGMFVYNPREHTLDELFKTDVRHKLAAAALGQEVVAQAACDIIIAGEVRRVSPKYGRKAKRFMLLEAGHVAQNILLQTISLELASAPIGAFDTNQVRKVCKLPKYLEPLYIICVGNPRQQAEGQKQVLKTEHQKPQRAALIVASEKFRDEELFETKLKLEQAGIQTVTVSTSKGMLRGMLGGTAKADISIVSLQVDDFDAIVFIGGSGAREYFNNAIAFNIARQAVSKRKVLAAISIAPAILANAGVLTGKKATCFSSERSTLLRAGVYYTNADVEQDGLIITANGPKAASLFGKTIAETLAGK